MDKEKDRYIKMQLQKDKLISKRADDVINEFLKEGYNMNGEEKTQKHTIHKINPWKKILATAACLVVVFGAANVYAYTQGYGNIFFMIKYLITGQNDYVEGKDAILSDRDITISYEPINLTENLSIVVKKLQIKDNTAKLILMESQKELDDPNLKLAYKVTDEDNNTLCEAESNLVSDKLASQNELQLENFKNDTKVINLKVSNSNDDMLATLKIDIENRTVEVAGEQEALQKISEIELKEFLGYAAGLVGSREELVTSKIYYDKSCVIGTVTELTYMKINPINKNDGYSLYPKEEIDQAIEEMMDIKASSLGDTYDFSITTENGKKYYKLAYGGDAMYKGECIDVNNISFCNGIYTVTYTYLYPVENYRAKIEDFDIFEQTINLRLNENAKYSKFKIVSSEEPVVIQGANVTTPEQTEEPIPTQTADPTPTPTQTNNPAPTNNTNIDNYATSMQWSNYWAPGLKFQYPTEFTLTDVSTGNSPGEVSTIIEGLARGIDPDTKEIIDSNLKITTYEPKFLSVEEGEAYLNINKGGYTTSSGMFWGTTSPANSNIEEYKNVEPLYSGGEITGYSELKVTFETNNRHNYKVTNIINWFMGSTQGSSY